MTTIVEFFKGSKICSLFVEKIGLKGDIPQTNPLNTHTRQVDFCLKNYFLLMKLNSMLSFVQFDFGNFDYLSKKNSDL